MYSFRVVFMRKWFQPFSMSLWLRERKKEMENER